MLTSALKVFQPVLAMLRMKFLPARDSVGESVLKVPDSASGIGRPGLCPGLTIRPLGPFEDEVHGPSGFDRLVLSRLFVLPPCPVG